MHFRDPHAINEKPFKVRLGYIHALAIVNRHKQTFPRQRHKHTFTNSANMWAIIFLYQTGE